ncbi:hypothetical protein T06_12051 [Trichinella sp. T6]|nr:hypothetical protein T06_12051 [Trichinella sp. T6]
MNQSFKQSLEVTITRRRRALCMGSKKTVHNLIVCYPRIGICTSATGK